MTAKLFHKNYSIHINDDSVEIQETEELISCIQTDENLSRHQACLRIWKAGKQILMERHEYGRPDMEILGALGRLYSTAKTEVAKKRGFAELYRELGPERFRELAEREGLVWEEVLDGFKELLPPPSRSDIMRRWIKGFLLDGAEHTTKEITEAAISDGVLADPKGDAEGHNRDLSLFRKIASGLDVSGGGRGKWQWPKEYIN